MNATEYLLKSAPELMSATEERSLTTRIEEDKWTNSKDINELISRNLRFVVYLVKHDFQSAIGIEEDDLIQAGCIGLQKAATKFKASRNTRFSTYASEWIRKSIIDYINAHSKTIRIPSHVIYKEKRARRDALELFNDEGVQKEWESIKATIPQTFSMYGNILEDDNVELDIKDENIELPIDSIGRKEEYHFLKDALGALKERERVFIAARFGLDNDDSKTLEEVGLIHGLTRERIRQIQNTALEKLRSHLSPIMKMPKYLDYIEA